MYKKYGYKNTYKNPITCNLDLMQVKIRFANIAYCKCIILGLYTLKYFIDIIKRISECLYMIYMYSEISFCQKLFTEYTAKRDTFTVFGVEVHCLT